MLSDIEILTEWAQRQPSTLVAFSSPGKLVRRALGTVFTPAQMDALEHGAKLAVIDASGNLVQEATRPSEAMPIDLLSEFWWNSRLKYRGTVHQWANLPDDQKEQIRKIVQKACEVIDIMGQAISVIERTGGLKP